MYRTLEDFYLDWENESKLTIKIFDEISDSAFNIRAYSDGRTLGFLAWHITDTLGEMGTKMGLEIQDYIEGRKPVSTISEIKDTYLRYSDLLKNQLNSKWNDNMLQEEISIYGQNFKRSQILKMMVYHQIHHRGQLTVMMRIAGLKVPGAYGPSKEEWSAVGMPPME